MKGFFHVLLLNERFPGEAALEGAMAARYRERTTTTEVLSTRACLAFGPIVTH